MNPSALVVDDSAAIRAVIRRILSGLGWDVSVAEDGRRALAVLDDRPDVSLMLVDWNMPGMDGIELIHAVRTDRRWEDVKIVMVTAESEPERVVTALDAGADEYVMKPFTREVLADKLELLGVGSPDLRTPGGVAS